MGVELPASQQGVVPGMEDDVHFSDSELYFHVRNALKLSIQGDTDSYNQLVGVMYHKQKLGPEEVALLVTCLKALSGAVSCIDIVHHQNLLNAIFGMSLWDYRLDVMDALLDLLLSLAVASNGKYIDLCLDMLVNNFVPPRSFVHILKEPRGMTRKTQVLDRVHSTFKAIAGLVPLSPMRLEKIVRDRMPNTHSNLDPEVLVIYVENMLRLEKGALGQLVGSTMLVAIVDSLIDLDVEIAWDDLKEDDFTKGIFDMELGEFEGVGDDEHDSDEMRESWIQKLFGGDKFAMKLDNLLVLTFEHLNLCYESGRLAQVFEILLQSFQSTVLTAYKSKFAQFVMFYACSLDPENCGKMFATTLLDIFMNSMYPQWRMSAVAYLASYLSRAKFVSASVVATILGSLVKWCSDYCKSQDGEINPKLHKVFYSGCQAVMYVLCFRMRSMVPIPRLKLQLQLLNIEEILKHSLSPLKVCLPSIVEEFLDIVREAQMFTVPETQGVYGILESENSRAFGGVERLDMFFPFDPCLLKKSDSFIRPNFVYWSMVKSTPDDDDEEDISDDDVAEAHEDEGGIDMVDGGMSFENHALEDGFGSSFDGMSITPKESLLHKYGAKNLRMQMPSKIRPSTSPESL